jgi:hypothetical protein
LLLIGIVQKYKKNINLILDCIGIIAVLSTKHPGLVRHCVYVGILDCVVAIMKQHPDDVSVQHYCVKAIQEFTTDMYYSSKQLVIGTTAANTTNDILNTNTGLKAVIQALKKFPEHCRVQHLGCQIMYNVSYEDLAERIIDAGAICVLAAAMETLYVNYDRAPIKSLALKAMKKLINVLYTSI